MYELAFEVSVSGRDGEEMRPDGLGSQRGVQGEDAQARGWGQREAERMRERVKASALRRERGDPDELALTGPCEPHTELLPQHQTSSFPRGQGKTLSVKGVIVS